MSRSTSSRSSPIQSRPSGINHFFINGCYLLKAVQYMYYIQRHRRQQYLHLVGATREKQILQKNFHRIDGGPGANFTCRDSKGVRACIGCRDIHHFRIESTNIGGVSAGKSSKAKIYSVHCKGDGRRMLSKRYKCRRDRRLHTIWTVLICCGSLFLMSRCIVSALFSRVCGPVSPTHHSTRVVDSAASGTSSSSSLRAPISSLTSSPIKTFSTPLADQWQSTTTVLQSKQNTNDETTQQLQSDDDAIITESSTVTTTPQSTSSASSVDSNDIFRRNRRIKIALGLVASIGAMAASAKMGILPGPFLDRGQYGEYTNLMIIRDSISTALAAVLAVALVKMITFGFEKGWYNSKIGRKLNHTLAAPLFIAFFPAFSNAEGARFFAGLVTFSNILRLYLAGTGQGDSTLAQTISRSGDKKEVLGGPFIYVCLFHAFIWLFWRNSFVGVIAMSTMAAGDGMADLVGRKWGANNKWSWSDGSKSKVGTLAFGLSAFVVSFGLASWLIATGCLSSTLPSSDLGARILLISFVTAFVELLPFGDDNYTVPGCAALMAALLLH